MSSWTNKQTCWRHRLVRRLTAPPSSREQNPARPAMRALAFAASSPAFSAQEAIRPFLLRHLALSPPANREQKQMRIRRIKRKKRARSEERRVGKESKGRGRSE